MRKSAARLLSFVAGLAAVAAAAADGGRIAGTVVGAEGAGLAGVEVTARAVDGEVAATVLTGDGGGFALDLLPAGRYGLTLALGERLERRDDVLVRAGETTRVDVAVDWRPSFAETLTVAAASRQAERLVEAPSAVTALGAPEVARQAAHGQLPRLLAQAPGVEMVEGSLYDLNLNVRGLNTFVNRRVLTLIDGRDPSLPVFAGGQEWAAISFPLDELASVELVRGPGAALYGAGAYNGVLDLVTKPASSPPAGRLRLTGGELDTRRVEGRWRTALGERFWLKLVGRHEESGTFTRPRVDAVEYAPGLLPREVVAPPLDEVEVTAGGVRLDGDVAGGSLTLEAGTAAIAGTTVATGIGRTLRTDVDRPWARAEWSTPRASVLAYHTGRTSRGEVALASGGRVDLDTSSSGVEVERRARAAGGRVRLVGGAFWGRTKVDSADPSGVQTVFDRPRAEERVAVFAQADVDLRPGLAGVVSLRWDDTDLQDEQLSPRAALVWSPSPRHTLRLSYSEAFQSPTLADRYLRAPVGPPADLSALAAALAPLTGGVDLGFAAVPLLAVGNDDLVADEVRAVELGWTAIAGPAFLTVDAFHDEVSDFVTNLVFQVGTGLGRVNPDFAPYRPPASLSPEAQAAVLAALAAALPPAQLAFLSNDAAGAPVFALLSFANFGRVDVDGVEVGLTATRGEWTLEASYTHLEMTTKERLAESPVGLNAPEDRAGLAVSWVGERADASLRARWADAYTWQLGAFVGPVPAHEVVDLSAGLDLGRGWRAGLEVSNLADDAHYEMFGGDLLLRRALAWLAYAW